MNRQDSHPAIHARYPHAVRCVVSAIALLMVFCAANPAAAQGGDAEAAPAAVATTVPVTVDVDSFGINDTVRAGDWAAIRLRLTLNTTAAALPVAVRVHIDDIDGDTALYQRTLTLTGGIDQTAWMYVPLPISTRSNDVFTVTVHEVVADGEQVGPQIAGTRIAAADVVPAERGLIAVIGQRALGLEAYELLNDQGGRLATSNEPTTVLSGLSPADLPDSWLGLSPFRVILWSAGDPARVSAQQARALVEWVERGGHLVVALPPVGGGWFEPSNPLSELVPMVDAERVEDVDYARLRNLLTLPVEPYANAPLPVGPAWVLTARGDASPAEATVIASGPVGGVAARRAVSTGLVTMIGLDLARRDVAQVLRSEVFWHALLGERFDIPTPAQMQSAGFANRLRSANVRPSALIDDGIAGRIDRSARAGVGVLLALIVFVAYWVVAGPGGYGVLRWKGLQRLSWPAFVGATLVFSGVAWIGARAASPVKTDAVQFDVFTSVYGTRGEHARSWISLLLPSYGDRSIEIRGGEDGDAMSTWAAPGSAVSLDFPDARSYVVDMSSLHAATMPARGTVKQLRADWHGASRWPGITLPDEEREPRLLRRGRTWSVAGLITNAFPGDLRDVRVFVSTGIRPEGLSTSSAGQIPVNAWALAPASGVLRAGEQFDLASLVLTEDSRLDKLFDGLNRANISGELRDDRDITRISWFSMLPPLEHQAVTPQRGEVRLYRGDTHGLDLSAWLSQPVLVVTGVLRTEGTDGPSPLLAPNEVPAERETLVRWVYPLRSDPVLFTNNDNGSNG